MTTQKTLEAYSKIASLCKEINMIVAELKFDLSVEKPPEIWIPPPIREKKVLVLTQEDFKQEEVTEELKTEEEQTEEEPKKIECSPVEEEYKFCVVNGKCKCNGRSRNKKMQGDMTLAQFRQHRRKHKQHLLWWAEIKDKGNIQ
jgi:hypothetical protein